MTSTKGASQAAQACAGPIAKSTCSCGNSSGSSNSTTTATAKVSSPFAFAQINVASLDRAEAFFEAVFGWRFLGEPMPTIRGEEGEEKGQQATANPSVPATASSRGYRVNYFIAGKGKGNGNGDGGSGSQPVGALFKFRDAAASAAASQGDSHSPSGGKECEVEAKETAVDNNNNDKKKPKKRDGTEQANVINYFPVDDVDGVLKAIVEAGGEVIRDKWLIQDQSAEVALFRDTEDNVFGLIRHLP